MTSEEKLKKLAGSLMAYKPEKIIAFGSCVRGETDEYSDIDLVVVKRTDKKFTERLVEAAEFIPQELGPVDIFVYTPEEFQQMKDQENPFIEQVLKDGRVIYERP